MELDLTTAEGRKAQGQLILRAIREAGLSVEQVAKDIGCSRALLYQYIAGTTLAQPDRLTQIAKRTGKPLAYFYGGEIAIPEALEQERKALEEEKRRWERVQAAERERRLRERMDSIVALAEARARPPDIKGAIDTYEQVLPVAREMGAVDVEATALFRIGTMRLLVGDIERGLASLKDALGLFERLGDFKSVLACRQGIGRGLLLMGRPDEAETEFEAVAHFDEWAPRWLGLIALAAVAEWTGDLKKAMDRLDEASELEPQAPSERDRQTLSLYLSANRANVYLACGDFAESYRLASEALLTAERLDDRDQFLESLLTLAVASSYRGDWVEAYRLVSRARDLAHFANDAERIAIADAILSQVLSSVGNFPIAKEVGMRALTASLKVRSVRAQVWAHKAVAFTYLREESPDDARYHIDSLLQLSSEMKNKTEVIYSHILLGWFQLLKGSRDEAFRTGEAAVRESDDAGMRHLTAMALFLTAQSVRAWSFEESWTLLEQGLTLAEEIGWADLKWRLEALKATWLVEEGKVAPALQQFADLNETLLRWRQQWTNAGYDDTLLEDPFLFRTCLSYARIVAAAKGRPAADQLIADFAWLPLAEEWEKLMGLPPHGGS
ncbi:MAG: helix-turn-helix domain-containing protein [Armatimonadetes bacterium]|nr:helix-turn-helix domain-containing protein [Armatimonadota bacterium]MDW8122684.1 helix-turn-helix domain-containing protein [Armatimonadota bacterium]